MNTNLFTMRLISLLSFILFGINCISAQTSLKEINLKNGKYNVGFRHYNSIDSTRTYSRIYDYTNDIKLRQVPMSIWYPSEQNVSNIESIKILDYFEVLKEEEEWEHLPNEQILNWFYYTNTSANQKHLKEKTTAYFGIELTKEKFPIVIYAPSYQASSIENFALCEFLASHGYVVISSPSRGTETRWFSNNNAKEMETQARDLELLIKEVGNFPNADYNKIALMGFSFGGLSNIIVQIRNDKVKAIVSLDGTERYQHAILNKSPFFDVEKMDVPYLHMSQKDIPANVLKEDNIDAELNSKFELYDSLSKSHAYKLKLHDLTHSYFSTLGVLFADRDRRQDKSDSEIMESYKLVSIYTLNFLNAVLKNEEKALKFIENEPTANGIKNSLITQETKKPVGGAFTFQDFNDLASDQNYENLFELYESLVQRHASFKIPEGDLNTLGLQLVFNPNMSSQGINVFLLAIKLYPHSANLFDSLAEGYLFLDKKEEAIESFKKSLELNSQNQNAINRLAHLNE